MKDIKIGDIILRRRDKDKTPEWIQVVVNKTYQELIKEYPEDYKTLNERTWRREYLLS